MFFCKNSCKDTTVAIRADCSNLAGVVSSHSDGIESILAGCLPNKKRPTSKLAVKFISLSYEPLVDCCRQSLDCVC